MTRTASGSRGGTILTVPSLRRTVVPFFQMFAADLLTPTSRAAADIDHPSASSSMNRLRASDFGLRPGPFGTRREDMQEPLSDGPRRDRHWKPPRRYGLISTVADMGERPAR